MKNSNEILQIGTTVYWIAGQTFCEGIVRDDLGKDKVNILCCRINEKRANQKIQVKREILIVKTKGDTMDDIKRKLTFNKFKKYSANQIIAKIEKGGNSDIEISVFKEILLNRGKQEGEINALIAGEEPKKEEKIEVVNEFVPEKTPEKVEVKKEPEMKVVHKTSGNSKVVEIEPEDDVEVVKEVEKTEKEIKTKTKVGLPKGKSITIEESEEVKGLKTGSKVTFKPSARLKIEGDIEGEIKKIVKSHKDGFKEYCQIKGSDGKVYYKRSNYFSK